MEITNKKRVEHDLLGERELTSDALYGIQTLRGIENFNISNFKLMPISTFHSWTGLYQDGCSLR